VPDEKHRHRVRVQHRALPQERESKQECKATLRELLNLADKTLFFSRLELKRRMTDRADKQDRGESAT